ncbi:hypothetical protein J1614_010970 [Plenodomus biglobosus]|nr:hypothetical protein J1614_010970 [Plenodomus biglobosus]
MTPIALGVGVISYIPPHQPAVESLVEPVVASFAQNISHHVHHNVQTQSDMWRNVQSGVNTAVGNSCKISTSQSLN